MTLTLTTLLCIGLSLGLRTPVFAGYIPKPILSVEPGFVVSSGTQVTFTCEGTSDAKQFQLFKGENYITKTLLEPGNKAEFSIPYTEWHHAGRYGCWYSTPQGWSDASDALELVVTGVYNKPSLSALPSPVVTSGNHVTLQCVSQSTYDRFILIQEGQKFSRTLEPQCKYTGQCQAKFSVGPVTSSQRWTFRCYSYLLTSPHVWSHSSDPLDLLFSGTLQKPSIWAEPGSVITSGSPVTIWCQGIPENQLYVLHKEGNPAPWSRQTSVESKNKANFFIPSTTEHHAGQYRCYTYSPVGWSEHSDLLELMVTGFYSKPGLSALPSPEVTLGRNMTFQCVSQKKFDVFILTKDAQKFSSMDIQYISSTRQFQALFPVDAVTPSHRGTFRCYGYYRRNPHVWSSSSDALEIQVSGSSEGLSPPSMGFIPTTGLENNLKVLIGVLVAFLLLLFFLILVLFFRRRHQGKHKKEGAVQPAPRDRGPQKSSSPAAALQEENLYASVTDTQPEDSVELDGWTPPKGDPQEETYTQVKPSKLRRTVVVSVDTNGRQAEEDRQMDSQDASTEEPHGVIYAQLCSMSLKKGTAAAPATQAGEPPEEPSVYAALASTRPGAISKYAE